MTHFLSLWGQTLEDFLSLWGQTLEDISLWGQTLEDFFSFNNAQHIVDTNYAQKIPAHETPLQNVYLSNFSQIYPEDRGTNYAIKAGKSIPKLLISPETQ